jgi:two-component system chemotaxis sensor kinase CheA
MPSSTYTMPQALSRDLPAPGRAKSTAQSKQTSWGMGKYREIIIAVAFFLLFDLGVLVLNFYTSFQISQDAVGINLSGRQRMLSQRTAKAIFSVEAAQARSGDYGSDLAELRKAVELFDTTLRSFQSGGTVPGGDGKPVNLNAVQGASGQAILAKAQDIWTPYLQLLKPVIYGQPTEADIFAAGNYARANNLALLGLMNDLTTALEVVAGERANNLRMVQTGGIVLALLNFAFILFKFLGRLRKSDEAIEAANEENREILTSVREGLFLITADHQIGSQVSDSANALFGQPLTAGAPFFSLLAPLVSPKALAEARDYVGLLFSAHIKEALVQDINPLQEVQVKATNRLGQDSQRYLSFQFNRVQEGNTVRHLLVTVQDISERMELQQKLKAERQRSQKEFNMLLRAFDADPATLRQFVARSESSLLEINEQLRATSASHGEGTLLQTLDKAWRYIHALKGDAATLGLETLAEQAHRFEDELARIRDTGAGTDGLGDALLALPTHLEDLLRQLSTLKNLTQNYRSAATGTGKDVSSSLTQLAHSVAVETRKQVQPRIDLAMQTELEPRARDLVREIAVQLIRNAVVHGIEDPVARKIQGKNEAGRIDMELGRTMGEWRLRVRDDGAGLSVEDIRQHLLDKGWYTPEQLEGFDDAQIAAHIFKPGFSTQAAADKHAGRGVGLDVVYANVQQLGGRLIVSSTPDRFTEFNLYFAE